MSLSRYEIMKHDIKNFFIARKDNLFQWIQKNSHTQTSLAVQRIFVGIVLGTTVYYTFIIILPESVTTTFVASILGITSCVAASATKFIRLTKTISIENEHAELHPWRIQIEPIQAISSDSHQLEVKQQQPFLIQKIKFSQYGTIETEQHAQWLFATNNKQPQPKIASHSFFKKIDSTQLSSTSEGINEDLVQGFAKLTIHSP